MNRWIRSAGLVLGALVASAAPCEQTTTADEAYPAAGMVIFLDPVTGELKQPEVADWAQVPRRVASKALVQKQVLPDGTIVVPAEAALQEISATLGDDGSLLIRCDEPAQ
jgi:hypothetical protein